jgi:hypothetical protein
MTREKLELELQLSGELSEEQLRALVNGLAEELRAVTGRFSFAAPSGQPPVEITAFVVKSERANWFKGRTPRK